MPNGGLGEGEPGMLRMRSMTPTHDGHEWGQGSERAAAQEPDSRVGRGRGRSWKPWALTACLLALAGVVASFDVEVAKWFATHRLPGDLGKAVMLSEAFAHGAGAATILLAVWLLDPRLRRGRLMWGVVAGSFCGGLVTDLIKLSVDRVRPRALDFEAVQATLATFATPQGLGGSDLHSFPSGHSAVAAGLACTLAVLYPRGRWLFAGVAAMACFQRIVASAHYPSDVLTGAAIGVAVATVCARATQIPAAADADARPSCDTL